MNASVERRDLVVKGENEITPHNVLVGDIWLCGGQSEKWIPREGFAEDPQLADISRHIDSAISEYQKEPVTQLPPIEQWVRDTRAAVAANVPLPARPEIPVHPSMPGSKMDGPKFEWRDPKP